LISPPCQCTLVAFCSLMGVVLTTEAAFYAAGAVQKRVKTDLLLGFLPVSVVQGLRSILRSGLRLHPLADAQHAHRKRGSQHKQCHRAIITRHDESPLYRNTATIMPLCTV